MGVNQQRDALEAGHPYAVIGLGANLPFEGLAGPDLLSAAADAVEATLGGGGLRSGVWASPAWPQPSDQPAYVNAVMALRAPAGMGPRAILEALLAIERQFGRERRIPWGARTMDLDLLDAGGAVVEAEGLILPHPRLHQRAFVLAPLAEILPDWRHPVLGERAAALLGRLPDLGSTRRLAAQL
ncbi:MAG: 2-amino-4-hydroxy-6-hydroxymethyldihydropteridine diphosphokinase [Alphaproteobacteria bacterium]|nr:2-amino-4-hydroxy-6-hydroxymethyldihydropteridine diphosphokinase [Alphaproteobacteria bacterium]